MPTTATSTSESHHINKMSNNNDIDDKTNNLTDEDLAYEEDLKKNPLSLNSWLRYLEYKNDATQPTRNAIYERAVKVLPRSYKLWHRYLHELVVWVRGKCIVDSIYDQVNNAFERSLIYLDKMPRIWIEYCEFLILQSKVTMTRRTFDRALKSLPITQHDRIWELYIPFVRKIGIRETITRVYKRWLKVEPDGLEDYIEYLIEIRAWAEATTQLLTILNNERYVSRKGKTRQELWQQLCDILTQHPRDVACCGIDCEAVIRSGITTYKTQAGKLWCALADYYVQLAQFDKARDIFEEAMETVSTARDFSQIWDSYTMFEDSLLAAQQQIVEESGDHQTGSNIANEEFDLLVARYENLIERQPFLLSLVLLRQNPHNVSEWHKRVALYHGQPKMVVETYAKAVATVDPKLAKGRPHTLWSSFAHYYEQHDKLDQARRIFERGVKVEYRTVDELATLYCEYAEMEIRNQQYERARQVLSRATISPRRPHHIGDGEPVQKRIWKSSKLWTFYVDVEESFGTFLSTKSIYDKMIQLKVVTPQIILNYADYLEENHYFEDSFKAYEQGVSLFPFPIVQDIWICYLTKFINRYGGNKLERARDLFEQVISKVPTKQAKIFYLMYANLEEQFGLARHSMSVYDRATQAVADQDKYNMYLLYINRTTEFYGLSKTREIYTHAIESLPDEKASDMCIRFADMERKHGEIDRARSIFVHGAQFSDPKKLESFWQAWHLFERDHGNEETVREMLRIKKSVTAQFNQVNLASLEMLNNKQKEDIKNRIQVENQQRQLERNEKEQLESNPFIDRLKEDKRQLVTNQDEINIDMDDENEEEEETMQIEEKQLPSTLFKSNIK